MQEIMAKVVHKNYEKLTDNLMWLGSKFILKFNVVLNKYSDKYGRENYHKEILYHKGDNPCIKITRNFDYFLSIECSDKEYNSYIYISQQDIYFFKHVLKKACEWFTEEKYQDMFIKKDNKIYASQRVDPLKITTNTGYLEFIPTIITYDTNGEQQVGVHIYLNSNDISTFINITQLLALQDFISTFNMYQCAIGLINYLQRPELGTELFDTGFNSNSNKSNKGFFDKVNAVKKD